MYPAQIHCRSKVKNIGKKRIKRVEGEDGVFDVCKGSGMLGTCLALQPSSPPALRPGGRRTEGSEGGRREIEKFNIISDTKIWG